MYYRLKLLNLLKWQNCKNSYCCHAVLEMKKDMQTRGNALVHIQTKDTTSAKYYHINRENKLYDVSKYSRP